MSVVGLREREVWSLKEVECIIQSVEMMHMNHKK